MAYVRQKGNQLAIVHGERDPKTQNVRQRVLFLFYTQAEARAAIGIGPDGNAKEFRRIIKDRHPRIPFNWTRIRKEIAKRLSILPAEEKPAMEARRAAFRADILGFARTLILTDPAAPDADRELVQEHWMDLEYVADLIRLRVASAQDPRTQPRRDGGRWRYELRGNEVPWDIEEHAVGFYEREEYDRAEASFRLLVECFDDYAEGYNYLGAIATSRGRTKEAIHWFEKTVKTGRTLFPRRLAKSRYWSKLSTRPYVRGLRNLTASLNEAGRHADALAVSTRLDRECGDDLAASSIRASVYLNTSRWEDAAAAALYVRKIFYSDSFIAAFALSELGKQREALEVFLFGMFHNPEAAPVLAGRRGRRPKDSYEHEDLLVADEILKANRGYFSKRMTPATRRFFARTIRHRRVRQLLDEIREVRSRWSRGRQEPEHREAFLRMNRMQGPDFALATAGELADIWNLKPGGRRT